MKQDLAEVHTQSYEAESILKLLRVNMAFFILSKTWLSEYISIKKKTKQPTKFYYSRMKTDIKKQISSFCRWSKVQEFNKYGAFGHIMTEDHKKLLIEAVSGF